MTNNPEINLKRDNKMRKIKFLILITPLLMFACEAQNPGGTSSTPVPGASSSSTDTKKTGSLVVVVKDGLTQQAIANATAKITLQDKTVLTQQTDSSGRATFDKLTEGESYNVEVSSNGYITNSESTSTSNLSIKADSSVSLAISLFKNLGSLTGRVISASGIPIESAVVSVGNDSALTGADGNFKVSVTNLTSQNVSIGKIGYNTLNYGNVDFSKQMDNNINDLKLSVLTLTPNVVFDTGKKPFGNVGDNINFLSSLSSLLSGSKFQCSYKDISQLKNFDNIDVIVLPSPSADYSDNEINNIISFVKSGKKLVVLGEWGGYGGFKSDSVNNILKNANLKIHPDVIKVTGTNNDEEIITSNFQTNFITKGLTKVSFYSSASVEAIEGGVKNLNTNITTLPVSTNNTSFRIEFYSSGSFGIIGTSTLGAGKVVALGDSSVFMNIDSNSNGIANIDENDNKKLALNIFNW